MFRLGAVIILLYILFSYVNSERKVVLSDCVLGGEQLPIEKLPWMASVQLDGRHWCGGSILNACTILTAAHCVHKQNHWHLMVRVGSSRSDQHGFLLYIRKIVVHEGFMLDEKTARAKHDLAVLKLSEIIDFKESWPARPVILPHENDSFEPGVMVRVSGWGHKGNSRTSPTLLQTAELPLVGKLRCHQLYREHGFNGIFDKQICTSYGSKNACSGDSGGPLTLGSKQIGIVSYGSDCARMKLPTVYTEIAVYRDWIDRHTMSSGPETATQKCCWLLLGLCFFCFIVG